MKKYLLLVLSLTAMNCKSTTEPTTTSIIMPLAVGNEWDYAEYGGIPHRLQFYDTIKIVSTKDDTTYVDQSHLYYQLRSNGLWMINNFYGRDIPKQTLLAKYPAQPGEVFGKDSQVHYISYPTVFDTIIADVVVDSINAVVVLPIGSFTCYKYRSDYYDPKHVLRRRINDYYALNIGKIKSDDYIFDSLYSGLTSTQLEQYTLH